MSKLRFEVKRSEVKVTGWSSFPIRDHDDDAFPAPITSSHSVDSPLSRSITPSLFHSRLKPTSFTNLSHHRLSSSLRTDSTDWTVSSEHFIFYNARNARIASAVLATTIPPVRLSVCLSVTRRYCVKTTARSTMQFAPLDSKMCLVL